MLELRKSGMTYTAIGQHFGLSAKSAYGWVVRAMEQLIPPENAEQVRTILLEECNEIINRLWAEATADNLAVVNSLSRWIDTKARLMGLYPREGHTVQVVNAINAKDEIRRTIRFVLPGQNGGPDRELDMSALPPNPYDGMAPNPDAVALEGPRPRSTTPFGSVVEEPRKPHPFDQQPQPPRAEPTVDPYGHLDTRGMPPDGRHFLNRGSLDGPQHGPPDPKGWMK
jgi:hypothetical protein